MKKLVFISNFMNHHQVGLAREFIKIYGEKNYKFIATGAINQESLNNGYEDLNQEDFIIRSYESEESERRAYIAINEAECVVIGSAPFSMILDRFSQNRLTFIWSERIFKVGLGDLQKF